MELKLRAKVHLNSAHLELWSLVQSGARAVHLAAAWAPCSRRPARTPAAPPPAWHPRRCRAMQRSGPGPRRQCQVRRAAEAQALTQVQAIGLADLAAVVGDKA